MRTACTRVWRKALLAIAFAWASAGPVPAEGILKAPTRLEVAEGVYVFMTPPYGEVGLDGNSIVIVSKDGVLVFDSNGTPAATEMVLAEIRKITDQPVRYVVNSHWHWDHWYGTEVYRRTFLGVHVITHEKTRDLMMGPALAFNKPGLDEQIPGYLEDLEKRVHTARETTPRPANLATLEEALAMGTFFLDQKRGVHHTFPDITFNDKLTLFLGEREIQVLNYGRPSRPAMRSCMCRRRRSW